MSPAHFLGRIENLKRAALQRANDPTVSAAQLLTAEEADLETLRTWATSFEAQAWRHPGWDLMDAELFLQVTYTSGLGQRPSSAYPAHLMRERLLTLRERLLRARETCPYPPLTVPRYQDELEFVEQMLIPPTRPYALAIATGLLVTVIAIIIALLIFAF